MIIITCLMTILLYFLLNKNNIIVTKINKSNLNFPNTTNDAPLKYFYEPRPHTKQSLIKKPEWLDTEPEYLINDDSLNDRFDYSIRKPENTYRIITLGDSLTFGLHVDTKDNYPELLEGLLNNKPHCPDIKKFEVINLGVPGYDIEYGVERMRVRGLKYSPDLVIWLIHQGSFSKIQDLISAKSLNMRENIENKADIALKELITELGEDKIAQHQTIALKSISNYYTGKLLIYTLAKWLRDKPLSIVSDFIKNRPDSYFIEGTTDLQKQNGMFPDHHPNQIGHQMIASEIFDYLSQNIIKCK